MKKIWTHPESRYTARHGMAIRQHGEALCSVYFIYSGVTRRWTNEFRWIDRRE